MAETVFTPQDLEVHQKIADHLRLDKEHIDRDGFMIESNEWGQHLLHWRGIRLLTEQEMTDIMEIVAGSGDPG